MALLVVVTLLLSACGDGDTAPDGSVGDVGASPSPVAVTVAIPNQSNLQWMNFWVAVGAGFFEDEGLDVEVVLPPTPIDTPAQLADGSAEVAVMPPPLYLTAIEEGQPLVVFANLMRNDPVNLVVASEVAEQRGLSTDMPLEERLEGMKGLRVGVAPGPVTRMKLLFDSVGLDADRDIEVVVVHGGEQNAAFDERRVDALYAHTPYLERALDEQGAVTVVDQISGEVPELAGFVRHALVTTEAYAENNPEVLVALSRAVHRAQQLIHTDQPATVEALRDSGVNLSAPESLTTIVEIYEPAIPETPEVTVEGVHANLELFPAHRDTPKLTLEDLRSRVAVEYAREAVGS